MALELAYDLRRSKRRLGSVVSISAGLLSHPATKMELETPVLYFTRSDPRASADEKALSVVKRAFKEVEVVRGEVGGGVEMPRGRAEWEEIMRFWGKVLTRPSEGWKGDKEVYEIVR